MAKGNPNFKEGIQRGRKSKADDPFYFIVNDTTRVSKNSYSYIISQRNVNKETGVAYEIGAKYISSIENIATIGLPEFASKEEIELFLAKTKGISQKYTLGKMTVKVPEGIKFDARDIVPEEEDDEEEVDDEKDAG